MFQPLESVFVLCKGFFRRRTLAATDQRVRLMNELLTCIKLIKMYAWEKPFSKSITGMRFQKSDLGLCRQGQGRKITQTLSVFDSPLKAIRAKEKSYLSSTAYVQSASVAITPVVPIIAVIVTFLAHIGFGYDLSPAEVSLNCLLVVIKWSTHY